MAKRGETRPWKLVFQYEGQPEHREAYTSEAAAQSAATTMREWAERTDRVVSTRVEYRER